MSLRVAAVVNLKHGYLGYVTTDPSLSLWVARVDDVPSVDEWGDLLSETVQDGRDYAIYRAGLEAVSRWGGSLLIPDPAPLPVIGQG